MERRDRQINLKIGMLKDPIKKNKTGKKNLARGNARPSAHPGPSLQGVPGSDLASFSGLGLIPTPPATAGGSC